MKALIIIFIMTLTSLYAKTLSGTVEIKGNVPKGTLYIFAKKFNSPMPMPLAVKRINNPKFPVSFSLSAKDAMMKEIPFKGPFKITARISPSGVATDKTGKEVTTKGPQQLGAKNIKLIIQ